MEADEAEAALTKYVETGKLEGAELEYYVGGGLPPPHYRSDQLRILTRDGKDRIEFATPNYDPKYGKSETYPHDVYSVAALPEDVKKIAGLLLQVSAFRSAPAQIEHVGDGIRTEIVVWLNRKPHRVVYPGSEPAVLAPVYAEVQALIARAKEKGEHGVYLGDKKLEPR